MAYAHHTTKLEGPNLLGRLQSHLEVTYSTWELGLTPESQHIVLL